MTIRHIYYGQQEKSESNRQNKFATDNSSIVEAMTRSSAAMAAANNTLEETIALNTASIEITRNAETTANAWKTKFYCLYVQKCA